MLKPTCQAEGCDRYIPNGLTPEEHEEKYGSFCMNCSFASSARVRQKARVLGELRRNYRDIKLP